MLQKKVGTLPEWDLTDLYDAPDNKKFSADMEQLKEMVHEFEKEFKNAI